MQDILRPLNLFIPWIIIAIASAYKLNRLLAVFYFKLTHKTGKGIDRQGSEGSTRHL